VKGVLNKRDGGSRRAWKSGIVLRPSAAAG
jgi:hypothetical protein